MDLDRRLREGPLKIRDVWSPDKTAALSARVLRLRRQRSLTRAAVLLGATLGAAGVLLTFVLTRAPREPSLRAAIVPAAAAPVTQAPGTVWLRDGSRAEPTAGDSSLAVTLDQPERVRLRLQRGAARFDVVKNPQRSFEVEAGDVRVRVRGTRFTVARTSAGERIEVEAGSVQVFWAGEIAVLGAGESGIYPPKVAPATTAATSLALREAPAERAHASDTSWRDLARRGDYRQAYTALRQSARVQDRPEDHMLAADVARLSGHPEQAVPHLRAVTERFRADPRAPVAAFTLGRVLADLQRTRDAAAAFHRARSLWPRGPLALDAWANEVEALRASGDAQEAARLAAAYLARHPEGRHASAMRALLAATSHD